MHTVNVVHISVAGWINVFVHVCIHKRRIYTLSSSPVNCRSTLCLHSCMFLHSKLQTCTDLFFSSSCISCPNLDFSLPSFHFFLLYNIGSFLRLFLCLSINLLSSSRFRPPRLSQVQDPLWSQPPHSQILLECPNR